MKRIYIVERMTKDGNWIPDSDFDLRTEKRWILQNVRHVVRYHEGSYRIVEYAPKVVVKTFHPKKEK